LLLCDKMQWGHVAQSGCKSGVRPVLFSMMHIGSEGFHFRFFIWIKYIWEVCIVLSSFHLDCGLVGESEDPFECAGDDKL
jgi:hypothetical protein